MEDKKVTIKVYYTSALGMMFTKDFASDTTDGARQMVEEKLPEWSDPVIRMESSTKQEDGKEYDVTSVVKYRFSHVEITDYTDGRDMPATEND